MHDLNSHSVTPHDVPTTEPGDTTWPLHQMRGWYSDYGADVDEAAFDYPPSDVPDAAALAEPAPMPPVDRNRAHRRQSAGGRWTSAVQSWYRSGLVFGGLMAVVVIVVCALGLLFSYGLLGDLAHRSMRYGPAGAWPLIVFGPWLVGSLAVLRSAQANHRIVTGWCVVVLFSAVTTTLCIVDARATILTAVIAGLPPISSLIVLHQMVRQVSAVHRNRPSHARGARPAKPSRRA